MWIVDKFGNPINMEAIFSLHVGDNTDNIGYYEVLANTFSNSPGTQFATSATMSESDAQTLLDRLSKMLGTVNLAD